MKTEIAH